MGRRPLQWCVFHGRRCSVLLCIRGRLCSSDRCRAGTRRRLGGRAVAFGRRRERRFRIRDRNSLRPGWKLLRELRHRSRTRLSGLECGRRGRWGDLGFDLMGGRRASRVFSGTETGRRCFSGSGRHVIGRQIAFQPAHHIAAFGSSAKAGGVVQSVSPAMPAKKRMRLMTSPVHASGSRSIPMKSAKALTFSKVVAGLVRHPGCRIGAIS